MDKFDLIKLVRMVSEQPLIEEAYQQGIKKDPFFQTHSATLQGSSKKYQPSPPFGEKNWGATKAFNDAVLARRFGDSINKTGKKKSSVRSSETKSEITAVNIKAKPWSPYEEYERVHVQKFGSGLGKALASGNMTFCHPGWTIGEKVMKKQSKTRVLNKRKTLEQEMFYNIETKKS